MKPNSSKNTQNINKIILINKPYNEDRFVYMYFNIQLQKATRNYDENMICNYCHTHKFMTHTF